MEENKEEQKKESHSKKIKSQNITPLSLNDCLILLFLLSIPFINVICLFMWALNKKQNVNKRNLGTAGLILGGMYLVFYTTILFVGAIFLYEFGITDYLYAPLPNHSPHYYDTYDSFDIFDIFNDFNQFDIFTPHQQTPSITSPFEHFDMQDI